MQFRSINKNDVSLFRAIRLEALRCDPDAFGETLESAIALSDSRWAERVENLISDSQAFLLALRNGTVMGTCGIGKDMSDSTGAGAFLWGVYVAASCRRQGVGNSIVKAAEEWAITHGFEFVNAKVSAPNEGAISFYKNIGYSVGDVCGVLRPNSRIPVYPISKSLKNKTGAA